MKKTTLITLFLFTTLFFAVKAQAAPSQSNYAIEIENDMLDEEATRNKLDRAITNAKDLLCGLKIRPSSVSISIGLVSATWSINDFCK